MNWNATKRTRPGWVMPKGSDGKIDHHVAMTGPDLIAFVDEELFPSFAYVIGIMSMILHGIEAPNIIHTNTPGGNNLCRHGKRYVKFGICSQGQTPRMNRDSGRMRFLIRLSEWDQEIPCQRDSCLAQLKKINLSIG